MSIQEIESAIARLPKHELAELAAWLADYQARRWDQQLVEDLEAGKFDSLLSDVDREYEAGLAEPL